MPRETFICGKCHTRKPASQQAGPRLCKSCDKRSRSGKSRYIVKKASITPTPEGGYVATPKVDSEDRMRRAGAKRTARDEYKRQHPGERSKIGDSRPVLVSSDGSIFHRSQQERGGKVLLSNLETGRSHWVSLHNLEHLYKEKRRDEVDINYRGEVDG